jgi:D-threo-aldose 1-dehydrogenase
MTATAASVLKQSLPRLGFGGAPLGNLYAPLRDSEARQVLDTVTATGAAYIDTAPYYGHGLSEQRIGAFLRARPDVRPMLSTKVGRRLEPCDQPPDHGFVNPAPFRPVFDYSTQGVRAAFDDSRRRLHRRSVDLLLLHDIGRQTHGDDHAAIMALVEQQAWPAMRALKDERATDAIGIGVNECEVVLECLDRGFAPDAVLLAGRHTLLDTSAERSGLIERCRDLGVVLIAAAPFNSGLLAGGDTFNYVAAPEPVLNARRGLLSLCAEFKVPLAAVALQFPLRNPAVACVLAGARTGREVRQQAAWLALPVPDELWRVLEAVRAEQAS